MYMRQKEEESVRVTVNDHVCVSERHSVRVHMSVHLCASERQSVCMHRCVCIRERGGIFRHFDQWWCFL